MPGNVCPEPPLCNTAGPRGVARVAGSSSDPWLLRSCHGPEPKDSESCLLRSSDSFNLRIHSFQHHVPDVSNYNTAGAHPAKAKSSRPSEHLTTHGFHQIRTLMRQKYTFGCIPPVLLPVSEIRSGTKVRQDSKIQPLAPEAEVLPLVDYP